MSNALLISESLLSRFKEAVSEHKPAKPSDYHKAFLQTILPYVTEQLTNSMVVASRVGIGVGAGASKGKTSSKGSSDSSEKKFNSWSRCWVSIEYGGKGYFKDDYEEIKATQKELKAEKSDDFVGDSHFTILKLLRDRLEGEENQARWVEWCEWVQLNNSDAPSDVPSERKQKQEGKKTATTVAPKVTAKVAPKVTAKVVPKVTAKVDPKVTAKVAPKSEEASKKVASSSKPVKMADVNEDLAEKWDEWESEKYTTDESDQLFTASWEDKDISGASANYIPTLIDRVKEIGLEKLPLLKNSMAEFHGEFEPENYCEDQQELNTTFNELFQVFGLSVFNFN